MIKKEDHFLIAGLGIEFAVIMCISVFGGRYLDRVYGTSPVFLLSAGVVGFAFALYVLVRSAQKAVNKDISKAKQEQNKEDTKK